MEPGLRNILDDVERGCGLSSWWSSCQNSSSHLTHQAEWLIPRGSQRMAIYLGSSPSLACWSVQKTLSVVMDSLSQTRGESPELGNREPERPCKRLKLAELVTLEQLPNLGPDFLGTLEMCPREMGAGRVCVSQGQADISGLNHLVLTV